MSSDIFPLRKTTSTSILSAAMTGYLTVQQAADHLGLTNARIRQFILAGDLDAERVGKKTLIIKTADVARLWDKRLKQQQRRQSKRKPRITQSNGNGHK
jgi:excisionase family DNA binding protein